MRTTVISTLIALLATSANAGLVAGNCTAITSIAFNSNMATATNHYLLALDKTIYSYLGIAEKIARTVLPNLTCYNVGNFGYSSVLYAKEFQNTNVTDNPLALTEIYYDPVTGTQALYDCIDSTKAAALISYLVNKLHLTIPPATLKTFIKLLKSAHFDVTFVLSNSPTISTATQNALVTAVKANLPKFTYASLH